MLIFFAVLFYAALAYAFITSVVFINEALDVSDARSTLSAHMEYPYGGEHKTNELIAEYESAKKNRRDCWKWPVKWIAQETEMSRRKREVDAFVREHQ